MSEKVHKLREDGTSAASPSTTSTDSSPEGEEGSSEEGSDYEDDEMEVGCVLVCKIVIPVHGQFKSYQRCILNTRVYLPAEQSSLFSICAQFDMGTAPL